ncbi:hypothetical protein AGMMS49545_08870 [Betaproteobacteria bacterium]|nr:hypothetical protein AGMMS49545_08870 [Betaproteobacteria bacterium]GHU43932.1 hypothetical protein AGMMS50289_11210 [Betaproteobacteria bacterium]
MKTIFLTLVLCFGVGAAHAEDVLQAVEKQLILEPVVRGEFVQTRKIAQIKKPLVSNGRFLVARNYGVIWENVSPITQTTRLTRNEIVQTDGNTTLMKLNAEKEPVVRIINSILFSVFSGDVAALAKVFDYSGKIEGTRWRLTFTPKDKNLARLIQELRLEGGRDVSSVELEGAAGDVTRIEFKATAHDKTLSDAEKKQFE